MITKEKLLKIIQESEDVATALESVAMNYNIPTQNILVDDTLKSIKVSEDCIIAPASNNPTANAKSIIGAIGACLDNISQRINDKIDVYQQQNISSSKEEIINSLKDMIDPRGNIISTHIDDDGNKVVLYDNGKIDSAGTTSAYKMIDSLSNEIDEIMANVKSKQCKSTYFTEEEDDISADMDISDTSGGVSVDTNDVSENINESYEMLELVEQYGFTNNLGYDIFKEYFDFIKPVNSNVYQESKTEVKPDDIKYMKFDNKNIIKAIKCFNEARAEQPDAAKQKIDIEKLIRSTKWDDGVKSLEKQFNCHLNIRFLDKKYGSNLYTEIYEDIKNKITISKTKGFQLGGSNVSIIVIGDTLDEDAPDNMAMFGQNVVSIFLHEIFHNISAALRYEEAQFECCLKSTLMTASAIRSGKKQRMLITKYVNTLEDFYGIKLNRIKRKALIKHLSVIASIQINDKDLNKIKSSIKKIKESDQNKSDADKEIEALIKLYEDKLKNYNKKNTKSPLISVVNLAVGIIAMIFGIYNSKTISLAVFCIGLFLGCAGLEGMFNYAIAKMMKQFADSMKTNKEEYYCDLFAGMYNLPVTFFLGYNTNGSRRLLPKDISDSNLTKLAALEKEIYKMNLAIYPTLNERNYAGVKIAQNALECGDKLDPVIKEYLEWIVENFKSTMDANIENDFNDKTFDPKEADELDNHLTNLITKGDIALTESFIEYINDSEFFD